MLGRYVTPPRGASAQGLSAAVRLGGAAALIGVVMALLEGLGGDATRAALLLERDGVLAGEVWRLALAQLVNLSPTHTILNILGLGLVTVTLWSALTPRSFGVAVGSSAAAIAAGWMLLQPAGPTYVGFSGITHGIFAFGALLLLQRGPVWFGAVVLACLAAKLGQEFFNGPVPGATASIGGEVSLISHALGTLGGSLAAQGCRPVLRGLMIVITLALALHHAQPGGFLDPRELGLALTATPA